MNESLLAAILLLPLPAGGPPEEVQTLTVRQAVALAVARAPEIAVARSAADFASAEVRVAASERQPQIFATTTPGYSTGAPLSVAGEVPAAAGVRVRMTLYDPGQRGDELQAEARAAGVNADFEDARVQVVRRTLAAAARLRADAARAESSRRRLEAWGTILRRDRALFAEGRITELDLDRASLEEARARQALFSAESDRDLDRFELARLSGLPPGSALRIADDPAEAMASPAPADTAALARERDPRLRALGREADALARSAKLLSQAFRPMVNAEGRYAYVPRLFGYDKYYLKFQENVASVGVSIALPILTGGRESAQAAQSRARLAQVDAQKRLREGEIALDAREAETLHERAGLELGLARRAVAISDAALRQAEAIAHEGRGELNEVERAQIELSDAEEKLARAGREQAEARSRLLALRGELLSALEVSDSAHP
jgi:outer membrane protein